MPLILIPGVGSCGDSPSPSLLQLGSYAFPLGTAVTAVDDKQNLPTTPVARGQGEAQLDATRLKKTVHLRGGFIKGQLGCTDVRGSMDALLAALYGGRQNFQMNADRYLRNVQAENIVQTYDLRYGAYAFWTVDLVAADPYSYEVSPDTSPLWNTPTGTTYSITPCGNTSCLPKLTFTFAAAAAVNLTIANTTTGDSMTLAGALAQSVVVVDSLAQTVTYGDGSDATLLFDGVFPGLNQGPNLLSVTANGAQAAALNNINILQQERWL